MTHTWKIGDWCETTKGERALVVDIAPDGKPCILRLIDCRSSYWIGQLKHLPLCDSWDWQPPQAPDPGEGYRPIDPAVDVPQEGDEIYNCNNEWKPRLSCFEGDRFAPDTHYRRKLPTYAPFTAESFKPHRDRWIRLATDPPGAGAFRVDSYDEYGYRLGNDMYPWHLLLDDGHVFDDTNTPCGVPQ